MKNPIELMHGNDWHGQDVSGWVASEKLNGWRAYWTGAKLLTRSGNALAAPSWFTATLPATPLDCELHLGRGCDHNDTHRAIAANEWQRLILTAFDVPEISLPVEAAIQRLALLPQTATLGFSIVRDIVHARQVMREIVRGGGEGIMLRKPGSPYLNFRNDNLLKLKGAKES